MTQNEINKTVQILFSHRSFQRKALIVLMSEGEMRFVEVVFAELVCVEIVCYEVVCVEVVCDEGVCDEVTCEKEKEVGFGTEDVACVEVKWAQIIFLCVVGF